MSSELSSRSENLSGDVLRLSFEEAMEQLESIVSSLERGDTPLQESVLHYKKAEELRLHCQKILDDAELVVQKIVQSPEGDRLVSCPDLSDA